MRNLVKNHWLAIAIFAVANFAAFWPVYLKGFIPFPGDLLVSFFFPWSSGGFAGFNPWTTHKEYLAADAIRQMFVWKSLGLSLWNPYNFSGTPLFANLQSSFLSLSSLFGWVPTVIVIMSLFGFFTYLFLRDLKLSVPAAILGGLAASNISYLTGWQEILVNCQSALFLPLILWLINKNKTILASIFLAFSIFGGHAQTTFYVYMIVGLYAIYKKQLIPIIISVILSICLAAIQLVPTIEAYLLSARETPANINLLTRTTLPWQGLITYFVSDFFGNTATNNLQPLIFNYADARAYIGLVPAVFLLFSLYLFKDKTVRFFLFLAAVGLILATWPGGLLFIYLKVPILSSVVPARMVMVFLFACAILAAYGFQYIVNNKIRIKPLFFIALIFLGLWIFVLISKTSETLTSRNNLIIPTIAFFTLSVLLLLKNKFPKIFLIGVFVLAVFEPAYYFVKHQPFSDPKYVFPPHPVFRFLQNKEGYDRFYGFGSAYIDNNFATYYKVFSAEGYDPLYIKRYGELIFSSWVDGQYRPKEIPRSDAKFVEKDNFYRNRLFDLLGVKYIIDKEDDPESEWTPDLVKFSPDKYSVNWHANKWTAMERLTVLPRVFFVNNYVVETDPQKILDKIYDPNFDLRKTLILEENPLFETASKSSGSASFVSYEPSRVVVKTQSDSQKLLFLSDSYFPGWKALIDGNETKIYRANYSFRAVSVPAGSHEVVFIYDPWSFKIGFLISGLALAIYLSFKVILK